MHGRRVGLGFWLVSLLLGCGGRVGDDPDDAPGPGGAPGAGTGGRLTAGTGGTVSSGGRAGAPSDPGPPYVDPECPDVIPPPPRIECDPLGAGSECPFGFACYPFVDHPLGAGCGTQSVGAACAAPGTGHQGDACGDGTQGCAAGHICIIGAQAGRRCARLCRFDGPNACPTGMICGETDIAGYGICT